MVVVGTERDNVYLKWKVFILGQKSYVITMWMHLDFLSKNISKCSHLFTEDEDTPESSSRVLSV